MVRVVQKQQMIGRSAHNDSVAVVHWLFARVEDGYDLLDCPLKEDVILDLYVFVRLPCSSHF